MGQLVLLVVAAAWAAVLVPPLLRSRIENRPNSSVSDFRDQLSSLQRAMPSRGVAMRSMARPLAQSPLSRPAAAGRPGVRGTGRTHGGSSARLNQPVNRRRPEPVRMYDATSRRRSHADTATRSAREPSRRAEAAPRQCAVRARVDRGVRAVPRRHHGRTSGARRRGHRPRCVARLRVRARPAAPARTGARATRVSTVSRCHASRGARPNAATPLATPVPCAASRRLGARPATGHTPSDPSMLGLGSQPSGPPHPPSSPPPLRSGTRPPGAGTLVPSRGCSSVGRAQRSQC